MENSNPVASRFRNQQPDLMLRVSRGDKTPLELFIGGVTGWDTDLRRMDERKVKPD
jgi:hypothetical protein